MPYFNKGDIVHIRSDLADEGSYYMDGGDICDIATENMVEYAGHEVTIAGFAGQEYREYTVKGPDGLGEWCWTDEMFDEYIYRESEPQQLEAEGDAAILEFISANKI